MAATDRTADRVSGSWLAVPDGLTIDAARAAVSVTWAAAASVIHSRAESGSNRVVGYQSVPPPPRRTLRCRLGLSLDVRDGDCLSGNIRVRSGCRGGRGELKPEYQPILATPDQRVAGVEALLRWTHPTLGAVGPTSFYSADRAVEHNRHHRSCGSQAKRVEIVLSG